MSTQDDLNKAADGFEMATGVAGAVGEGGMMSEGNTKKAIAAGSIMSTLMRFIGSFFGKKKR